MRHLSPTTLSLLAGGDLSGLERWRATWHTRTCSRCASEVEAYRGASTAFVAEGATLPARLHWDALAAEMTADIRLGLQAAECVRPAGIDSGMPLHAGWRAAAVMAGMSLMLAAAWWLNPPPRSRELTMAPRVEMRATSQGIELKEGANAFTLLHTREGRSSRPIIVSAPGALRARFVDTETGQVTINNVYAE